jgi:PST family polysaccharide transporter
MAMQALIRSLLVIGSAKSITIALALLRVKVVALVLGPAGIGTLSILSNVLQFGSALASLGLGQSGVRQIAASRSDPGTLSRVRQVLIWANVLQGVLGALLLWSLRAPIARLLFGDAAHATEVGVLGLGVLATLVAGSQMALLRGLQRIGELAMVTVAGALAGTVAGLAAILALGADGLVVMLLTPPLASILAARRYTRRLPPPEGAPPAPREAASHWCEMAALGLVFTAGSLLTLVSLLAVRGHLTREMGLEAVGLFQASWAVAMQYIGVLLDSMKADYYPRLAAVISDREEATKLVNQQSQLAMAVGGPLLILLIGLAPWVVELLYSAEFAPAATILQWQLAGNIPKLMSWPLGLIFVAGARSGVFFLLQLFWNAVFLALFALGLPVLGLEAAGIAFLAAYGAHLAVVALLARRLAGHRWERRSVLLGAGFSALGAATLGIAFADPLAGALAGTALACASGLVGLRVLLASTGTAGRLTGRLARLFARAGWPLEGRG